MGKPSIFSSNYKQQLKKRRLNTFLFILLLICAGFFGGKYYLDKNNISLAKKFENNKIISSIHIPDVFGKIKNAFSGGGSKTKEQENPPVQAVTTPKPTKQPAGKTGNAAKIPTSTTNSAITTVTGEYIYLAKNGYKFTVEYKKLADKIEITGLNEDTNTSEYCISTDKSKIVFDVKQDNRIVMCDSSGIFKILSRDEYRSTTTGRLYKKDTVLKTYENYIWAQKPYFTNDGRVVYVSRIPYFKSSKNLYLWSVSLDGKIHKRIYEIGNDISKLRYDGYDNQNRLKVTVGNTNYYLDIGSYMLRKYK